MEPLDGGAHFSGDQCKRKHMIQAEMLLPQACRTQLQMSKPKTITEMVGEVEQSFAGRSSSWDDPKWTWRKPTYQPGSDNSRMKEDKATTPSTPSIPPRKAENTPATPTASWAGDARYWADRTCYYCRKPGHIAQRR